MQGVLISLLPVLLVVVVDEWLTCNRTLHHFKAQASGALFQMTEQNCTKLWAESTKHFWKCFGSARGCLSIQWAQTRKIISEYYGKMVQEMQNWLLPCSKWYQYVNMGMGANGLVDAITFTELKQLRNWKWSKDCLVSSCVCILLIWGVSEADGGLLRSSVWTCTVRETSTAWLFWGMTEGCRHSQCLIICFIKWRY